MSATLSFPRGRRMRLLLLSAWAVAGLAACGRKAPEAEHIIIGAVPKSTTGEFWEAAEAGARKAAAETGVELVWEGTATEVETAGQNKIIEQMIAQGVDGIALAPLNRQAQRRMVEDAVRAGVPVVIFDSPVDGVAHSAFVGTNSRASGALAANYLSAKLPQGASVAVMRFMRGGGSTEERAEGFIDAARAAGLRIDADPYAEIGTVEGVKVVAANLLKSRVRGGRLELDAIFSVNLLASLGVSAALDELHAAGVEIDTVFVAYDTCPLLVERLKDGHVDALVVQNPERTGYLAVQTLHQLIRGEEVPPFVDTGTELVTRETLSE